MYDLKCTLCIKSGTGTAEFSGQRGGEVRGKSLEALEGNNPCNAIKTNINEDFPFIGKSQGDSIRWGHQQTEKMYPARLFCKGLFLQLL